MSTGGGENWLGRDGTLWEAVSLFGDGISLAVCPYPTALQTANNKIIRILMRAMAGLDIRLGMRMSIWSQHVGLIEKD